MVIRRASPILGLLFTILTCGFYSFFWIYRVTNVLYYMADERGNAAVDLLISIVTCGIYLIYLNYKWGKLMYKIRVENGLLLKDDSILLLILSLFSLGIISLMIVQSNINDDLIPIFEDKIKSN